MPLRAGFEYKLEAKDSVLSKVKIFVERILTLKAKGECRISAKVLLKWVAHDGSEAGESGSVEGGDRKT